MIELICPCMGPRMASGSWPIAASYFITWVQRCSTSRTAHAYSTPRIYASQFVINIVCQSFVIVSSIACSCLYFPANSSAQHPSITLQNSTLVLYSSLPAPVIRTYSTYCSNTDAVAARCSLCPSSTSTQFAYRQLVWPCSSKKLRAWLSRHRRVLSLRPGCTRWAYCCNSIRLKLSARCYWARGSRCMVSEASCCSGYWVMITGNSEDTDYLVSPSLGSRLRQVGLCRASSLRRRWLLGVMASRLAKMSECGFAARRLPSNLGDRPGSRYYLEQQTSVLLVSENCLIYSGSSMQDSLTYCYPLMSILSLRSLFSYSCALLSYPGMRPQVPPNPLPGSPLPPSSTGLLIRNPLSFLSEGSSHSLALTTCSTFKSIALRQVFHMALRHWRDCDYSPVNNSSSRVEQTERREPAMWVISWGSSAVFRCRSILDRQRRQSLVILQIGCSVGLRGSLMQSLTNISTSFRRYTYWELSQRETSSPRTRLISCTSCSASPTSAISWKYTPSCPCRPRPMPTSSSRMPQRSGLQLSQFPNDYNILLLSSLFSLPQTGKLSMGMASQFYSRASQSRVCIGRGSSCHITCSIRAERQRCRRLLMQRGSWGISQDFSKVFRQILLVRAAGVKAETRAQAETMQGWGWVCARARTYRVAYLGAATVRHTARVYLSMVLGLARLMQAKTTYLRSELVDSPQCSLLTTIVKQCAPIYQSLRPRLADLTSVILLRKDNTQHTQLTFSSCLFNLIR